MTETPRQLGYRMPAEWEPHQATWLAWPHNPEDWPGKFQAIPWVYAEIVRLLSAREHVQILVDDLRAEHRAQNVLERSGATLDQISFHRWPTNRVWTRDSGPIFIRNVEGRVSPYQLAFQRLGQVRRLAAGRSDSRPGYGTAAPAGVAANDRVARRIQTAHCPRRRLHRHQRRRHSAYYGGVPLERGAAAQSRCQSRAA